MNMKPIVHLRKGLGMTQVEFAELLGTHESSVSKAERGVRGSMPKVCLNRLKVVLRLYLEVRHCEKE